MTAEDHLSLRAFWDSPEGQEVSRKIQEAYTPAPLQERRGESFWRDTEGVRLPFPEDEEIALALGHDANRTFRPMYLARRVSYWPTIMAIFVACVSCAALIAWGVSSALGSHP